MRIKFLGIPVDALTMQETVNCINDAILAGKRVNHVVINASKVVAMQSDSRLFESVVSCDLINADGQSIVWASKFLGNGVPERVTGIDLMEELIQLSAQKQYKCFFFGAKEDVVKQVVAFYSKKYGAGIIAGYRNGYYNIEEEPEIARQIASSGAQLLFVAITSPRKENFMFNYREELSKVNFTMGVGGSFDVVSGFTRRAPHWMRNNGLEWFYRLAQEPKRMWRRYFFGNIKFIRLVLSEKMKILGSAKNENRTEKE